MKIASLVLLGIVAVAYLIATIRIQQRLFAGETEWDSWRGRLRTIFALHTVSVLLLTGALGHPPIGRMDEAIATTSWLIMLLYLIFAESWKIEMIGTIAAPASFVLNTFSVIALGFSQRASSMNMWLGIHVTTLILGYGFVFLAAFCAVLYYIQARLLKQKKLLGPFKALPSLDALDTGAYRLILAGFPLMVLGIATGLALNHWQWLWDPKFSTVAITGIITLLYLHARLAGWQGKKINLILIVALVMVITSLLVPGKYHPL